MLVTSSSVNYSETVASLLEAIEQRGLTVFARIDHAAGAHAVGLQLANEEVVIFGSPKSGTPLMLSDPRVGIELPLRILIWEEEEDTKLGYEDPAGLLERYEIGEHEATLLQMSKLLAGLVEVASNPT
jgi:uncharacterized protein (DUF302 family)